MIFLLYEQSFEKCQLALSTLITLLRSLGFRINWKKMCDQRQCLVFLGIEIDLCSATLRLDQNKRDQLIQHLKDTSLRKRLTRRSLQVLGGRLTWAGNVIRSARAHMNSIFHSMRHLKQQEHKTRMTTTLLEDLQWWIKNLQQQPPWRPIWPQQQPAIRIATDSSLIAGGSVPPTKQCLDISQLAP